MPYALASRLGDAVDCSDPGNWIDPSCAGVIGSDPFATVDPSTDPSTDDGSGIIGFSPSTSTTAPSSNSGANILSTVLTDVTQFFHPGTPSTIPLYRPAPTGLSAALSNPLVIVGGIALLAALAGKRQ